ncbi:MAG: hypothetical protein A3F24_03085 [Candidatus Colwellbacteria bacterium RIFCSPHIGHO2_12_FULL_44_17]|uniref:Protein containing YHS domain protein n=1 Tax=Candidatus Colwellbacteria bacterium RIFCSPHIGHO2_12_FULL_44_17 TaxID=1797689 RepID=A0A1G1Z2J1_9BACT|nr:MAG: hypothetical protein A3F24_03085 [Candidatus Colwellbacteria bacterium RIFCSPHIGHO2_12_FULL_44_17]
MIKEGKHKHPEHLKYKICLSGAAETGHCSPYALERAEEIGKEIARHGLVLVTGATTGAPYWAAKGAKEAGGIVIGFSPAVSEKEHIKMELPVDYHDMIFYTGYGFSSRNLLLIRSADAVITVCGRIGTLNEFSIAFEDEKPVGVLQESGGIADMIKEILDVAHRGAAKIVFDAEPRNLVEKIIETLSNNEEK